MSFAPDCARISLAPAVLGMDGDRDVSRARVALVLLRFILRDPKSQKAADDPTGGTSDRRAAERRHDRSRGDKWSYSRDGERPNPREQAQGATDSRRVHDSGAYEKSRARRYSKNVSTVLECAPRKLGNDFEVARAPGQFPAHPIRGQPRPTRFLALFARAMHMHAPRRKSALQFGGR
jgi:hypothetical protein